MNGSWSRVRVPGLEYRRQRRRPFRLGEHRAISPRQTGTGSRSLEFHPPQNLTILTGGTAAQVRAVPDTYS